MLPSLSHEFYASEGGDLLKNGGKELRFTYSTSFEISTTCTRFMDYFYEDTQLRILLKIFERSLIGGSLILLKTQLTIIYES